MSIGSILSVARTALNAHQAVIQTAGHNIANVETPGYSRQRVELTPGVPQYSPQGAVGTGVKMDNVTRVRDTLLDAGYREEAADAAAFTARRDLLGAVESVLGEPSEDGLAATMDAFWSSWSDLGALPTSGAARSAVQQRGAHVVATLNGFDARLDDLRGQAVVRVKGAVDEINNIAEEVGALNARIVQAEVGGRSANDLRDQRDLALDRLAQHGDVRVIDNPDGSVQVLLGNNGVVDGITVRRFKVTDDGTTLRVGFANSDRPMLPLGGSVTKTVEFVNGELPETRDRLDALAEAIVTRVNAAHGLGQVFAADGTPSAAGPFFDPAGLDAGTIRLSDAVAASTAAIAASAAVPGPGQVAGAGNNEVALALAALRTRAGTVSYVRPGGDPADPEVGTFASFYRETTTRLGAKVKDAESSAAVHTALATNAETRRTSVSGVNLDEELTTLMRAQQAYAAAAKVVNAAEEMLRTLVEMV